MNKRLKMVEEKILVQILERSMFDFLQPLVTRAAVCWCTHSDGKNKKRQDEDDSEISRDLLVHEHLCPCSAQDPVPSTCNKFGMLSWSDFTSGTIAKKIKIRTRLEQQRSETIRPHFEIHGKTIKGKRKETLFLKGRSLGQGMKWGTSLLDFSPQGHNAR